MRMKLTGFGFLAAAVSSLLTVAAPSEMANAPATAVTSRPAVAMPQSFRKALIYPEQSELLSMRTAPDAEFVKLRQFDIIWTANLIEHYNKALFDRLRDETDATLLWYQSLTAFKAADAWAPLLDRKGDRETLFQSTRDDRWYFNLLDPDVRELVAHWYVAEVVRGRYRGFAWDNVGLGTERLKVHGDAAEKYGVAILALMDRMHEMTAGMGLVYVANHNVPLTGDQRWLHELTDRKWLTLMFEGERGGYNVAAIEQLRTIMDGGQTIWLLTYDDDLDVVYRNYAWWKQYIYDYDPEHTYFSVESKAFDGSIEKYPFESLN